MSRWRRSAETEHALVIALADGTPIARVPESTRLQLQYFSTRLELSGGGIPPSIAVTSALPGEGVTYISRALACVLSEDLGRRTCLVDANWSATVPNIDGIGPGLAGALLGTASLDTVIRRTRYDNLAVVAAGELSLTDRSRLSTAARMGAVLEELRQRFDHIVIDLPAVAESTATLTVAAAADAALLVARQRMTRRDQIEAAIDDLRPTRLLGVILNDHRLRMPEFLERRLLDA